MNKLLVSALGNKDSGKSYTWNTLFGVTVRTGKKKRRLYFNDCEYVTVFLISGSPEERKKYVGNLMIAEPRIVLCSTQYCESSKKTFSYFIENEYSLFVHWLNPGYSDLDRPYFDYLGIMNWLLSQQSLVGIRSGKLEAKPRVDEIKEYIYGWAKSRNLIINECE
ncbi:hypothetical protein [Candidatus Spongiihabitans sp.]|uniref:hypothetical protein n=1 Tax=Candidatus Spongiihabitans sp. TaxID=3101308 RepID=UPI003C6ECFAA